MFESYSAATEDAARRGLVAGNPLKQPVAVAREAQRRYLEGLAGSAAPVARVKDVIVPGPYGPIPVRLSYPRASDALPVVVHVRGGGWWSGSLDASTAIVNHIANASDCTVCSIDYRFAPEHRYPVQLNEVLATISWLRRNADAMQLRAAQPVLFGESAGSSLCLAAAMRLRDSSEPRPLAIVQFYTNALGPPANALAMTKWVWESYLPDQAAATDIYATPLRGNVSGLPPMFLGVGELDHLLVDTMSLAERCERAGVPFRLHRYPDLPHAFLQFVTTLGPAVRALDDASAFIGELVKPLRSLL